jgi:hypothetical protein
MLVNLTAKAVEWPQCTISRRLRGVLFHWHYRATDRVQLLLSVCQGFHVANSGFMYASLGRPSCVWRNWMAFLGTLF